VRAVGLLRLARISFICGGVTGRPSGLCLAGRESHLVQSQTPEGGSVSGRHSGGQQACVEWNRKLSDRAQQNLEKGSFGAGIKDFSFSLFVCSIHSGEKRRGFLTLDKMTVSCGSFVR